MIGSPFEDTPSIDGGSITVIYGKPAGLDLGDTQGFVQTVGSPSEPSDRFGEALAAGDFDGNGRMDLAVGTPNETIAFEEATGYVNLFRGTPSGLVEDDGYGGLALENKVEAGTEIGASLAAGDLDGDGDDELVVGSPDAFGPGRLFVQLGTSSGLSSSAMLYDLAPVGEPTPLDSIGDYGGLAMGDVDGDDDLDLGVGVPNQTTSERFASGAVMVLDLF